MINPEILDDLHHRPPYLLIDNVIEVSESHIHTIKTLSEDEYFFKGHFPGAPIVPGALLHEMTTQSAGVLIARKHNPMKDYNTHDPYHNEFALGVLSRIYDSKFKGFAKPNDQLNIKIELIEKLENAFRFKGKIYKNDEIIMKNEFSLMNIPSKLLYS